MTHSINAPDECPDIDLRPVEEIRRSELALKTHCLNMLGQLEKRENYVPRLTMDLASLRKLEEITDDTGSTLRIKPMFREE